MIKAVLFDFDGVLTTDATGTTSIISYYKHETDHDWQRFEKAYRKHNENLLYGTASHQGVWPEICAEYGQELDIEELHAAFVYTPLDPAMLSLAHHLKASGYLIGMITDNKKDRIHKILDHHKLWGLFDVITISDEVGSGKRNLAIFQETFQSLAIGYEEAIFIDNNPDNLMIPEQLGTKVIFFNHHERRMKDLMATFQNYGIQTPSRTPL